MYSCIYYCRYNFVSQQLQQKRQRGRFLSISSLVDYEARYQNFLGASNVTELYNALQDFKPRAKTETRRVPKLRLSPARRALDIDELTGNYKAGWSLRQLAQKNGICRDTVTLQLRKAGITIRRPGCNVRMQEQ